MKMRRIVSAEGKTGVVMQVTDLLDTETADRVTNIWDSTFGEGSTRKYIFSISIFIFMNLWLNGCRVPLETTDKVDAAATTN